MRLNLSPEPICWDLGDDHFSADRLSFFVLVASSDLVGVKAQVPFGVPGRFMTLARKAIQHEGSCMIAERAVVTTANRPLFLYEELTVENVDVEAGAP